MNCASVLNHLPCNECRMNAIQTFIHLWISVSQLCLRAGHGEGGRGQEQGPDQWLCQQPSKLLRFGSNMNYLRKVNVRLMPNPKSIFLYLCIFPAHKGGKGGGWETLLQRVNQHAAHATFIMQLFTCIPVCKLINNTSGLRQNRMFFFVCFGNVCCTLVPFWEACFCQVACC